MGAILIKYRHLLLLVLIILSSLSFYNLFSLEVDQDFDSYFPKNNPDQQLYKLITSELGNEENLIYVALINNRSALDTAFLRQVNEFVNAAKRIGSIKRVYSLINFKNYRNSLFGLIPYSYFNKDSTGSFIADEDKIFRDSRIKDRYLSRDGKALFLTLQLKPKRTPILDDNTIASIEEIANNCNINQYVIGGTPYYEVVYNRASNKEIFKSVSMSFGVLILLLGLVYRSFWGMLIPLVVFSLSLINLLGYFVLIGHKIEGMTSLIPTIILVVSVSDVVHVFSKYEDQLKVKKDRTEALISAINKAGLVTFLTSLTTAIGFIVLALSPIPVLVRFSLDVAVGVLISYAVTMVVLVFSIMLINPSKLKTYDALQKGWDSSFLLIKKILTNKNKTIEITCIILGILGLVSLFYINTNHTLDSAASSKDLRSSVNYFDTASGGARSFQMAIFPHSTRTLHDLEVLYELEKIEKHIESIPEISGVLSPLTYYKSLNMSLTTGSLNEYYLPESQEILDKQIIKVKNRKPSFVSAVLNKGGTIGKVTGFIPDLGRFEIKKINYEIENWVKDNIDANLLQVKITGSSHMIDVMQEVSIKSMFLGLILTFFIIGIIMAIALKNVYYVFVSIIINILPLLLTAMCMVLFDIELRFGTSIIFTIGYVIAVDDTIHTLLNYKINRNLFTKESEALFYTIKHTGKALVLASFLLIGGLGILITSSFRDVHDIGLLTVLLLFFALASDLFLCPKLLLNRINRSKENP